MPAEYEGAEVTTMDKQSFDKLVETIEDAGFEARRYFGRGRGDRDCLGVKCDSPMSCVMQIVSTLCENASDLDEVKDFVDALSDPSSDSMGRSSIVYWTSIPWTEEEEPEDDESEDEEEDEEDEEDEVVMTLEYERAHGRAPSGDGNWAFFIGASAEPVFFNGPYKECRAKAVAEAVSRGEDSVRVGP